MAPEMEAPAGRPSRRRPIVAALVAIVGLTMVATLALAGPGADLVPAGGAASPAVPAAAPAVQDGGIVDVGWVAPGANERAGGPGNGPGNGRGQGRNARLGAITITRIDGSTLGLTTEDGWTRTIDAAGATITRGGTTIAVGDLAVGDEITLRQERQADGSFTVTAIHVVLPRVAGTVAAVTGSSITLATRGGAEVTVKVTAATTYRLGRADADKGAVKVGVRAVATGSKDADGTLTATSVVVQAERVAGTVTATGATSITIETRKGATMKVTVGASTTYRVAGVATATLDDVKVGMVLVAAGVRTDDTTLAASSIGAMAAGDGPRGQGKGWGWEDGKLWRGWPKGPPSPAGTQPPSSNG